MPSQKPRLALTLPPELEVALSDYAEAVGKPVSAATVEMLVQLIPQFEGLTKFAIAAKSGNKAAAKRALVHMVGDNMAELMQMQQADLLGKKRK
jgi:hypothetical protein